MKNVQAMGNLMMIIIFPFTTNNFNANGQAPERADLETGMNFIETRTYSADDDRRILELYKNLRVADVSDGLDMVGLPATVLVDQAIHPDWVDLKDFSHVFRGIAVTVRYVPTQRPALPAPGEDFSKWEGNFYNIYSNETFTKLIRPGSAIIIDDVEDRDIGSIGSNNILGWCRLGAVGVVTDAGARDTDEVGLERVPLFVRQKAAVFALEEMKLNQLTVRFV